MSEEITEAQVEEFVRQLVATAVATLRAHADMLAAGLPGSDYDLGFLAGIREAAMVLDDEATTPLAMAYDPPR